MADPTIKIKRSAVAGKIPTPDQVPLGELALNTYDGYLYASKNVGIGTTVIAINPFRVGTGTDSYNAYFTAGNVGIGTTTPTSKFDVLGNVKISGITTSSRITLNGENNTANGGGQIYLNGATANRIDFNTNGTGAPTFTTRSAGTKIVIYPSLSPSDTDYALGMTNGTLWHSVAFSGATHRWYAGTTALADLKGTGELVIGSTSLTGTASQRLQVTGGAYVSDNTGIGTINPASKLDVRGTISIGRTDTVGINSIRSVVDINSWEYYGVSFSVSGQDTAPADIYFKDDGTKMFILGDSGNDVNEYLLSTPWEVNTATFTTNFSVAAQDTNPAGLYFKPDGTRMYICGTTGVSPTGDRVYSYTLSNPWSLASGVTYDNKNFNSGANDTTPGGVYFKDDGTKMYVVGATGDAVYEYTVSTAWEIDSTVTLVNTLLIGTANTQNLSLTLTTPVGIDFNTTGTKMYITDSTRDVVSRFDLSIGWDLSTATFYDNVYVGFQEINPTGIFYQEDQSKAYIVGTTGDTVYQYNTDVPSLELASSGISTRSSIILNNEARLNNRLYVTGDTHISSNTILKGTLTVDSTATIASTLTASGAVTASTTTGAINFGTSQTTGTLILGGTSQTGTITLGRATTSQTTDIQAGVTASGNQKTINLGTGGASGSRTLITVGSATAGAISTVTIPSPTNLLIGTATTTGTASQPLQVTGGAYVSGSVGIGITNPQSILHLQTSSGNTKLIIESDADNNNEADNAYIIFRGDGGVEQSVIKNGNFTGNNDNQLIFYNSTGVAGGIIFATGTDIGYTNALERLRITPSGNIGIATTNPTSKLDIQGNAKVSGVITASGGFNLGISSAGTSITSSPVTTLNFIGAGNTFAVNGTTVDISIAGGGSASATVAISTVAPTSPTAGDMWYNSILGRTFIYYNDGDSSQWVDSAPFNIPTQESDPVLQAGKTSTTFAATQGQKEFVVSHTIGYVDVYLNGVRLSSAEFAEDGSKITLADAASAGDVVDVVEYRLGIGDTGPRGPASVLTIGTRAGAFTQSVTGVGLTISLRSGIATVSF